MPCAGCSICVGQQPPSSHKFAFTNAAAAAKKMCTTTQQKIWCRKNNNRTPVWLREEKIPEIYGRKNFTIIFICITKKKKIITNWFSFVCEFLFRVCFNRMHDDFVFAWVVRVCYTTRGENYDQNDKQN